MKLVRYSKGSIYANIFLRQIKESEKMFDVAGVHCILCSI